MRQTLIFPTGGRSRCEFQRRDCADFMWMHRDGAVEFYKHIITRRYLMLDGEGNCLRWSGGELQVVDFEPEYLRVTGME